MLHQRQVVGVNFFKLGVAVVRGAHEMCDPVDGDQDRRSRSLLRRGRRDFGPQGLEDGPCDLGVLCAKLGEAV